MSCSARIISLSALAVMLCPLAARAQYNSELVGFNGPPIDDPATSQEMFRIPEWSGSTTNYVVHNVEPYDNNAAFRAAGLHTEGAAAMQVFFNWVDPADPDSWVRLTTFNGPERPNPALHTEGKVRFKVTNRSELVLGEIGMCLGIRETGVEVPQLADGGTVGDIEWVGVDTTPNGIIAGPDGIVDTAANPESDDVQVYPVGYDINNDPNEPLPSGTAVVSPGLNGVLETTPVPDDELRFGYFIAANGTRTPIPAITLPPSPVPYELEWDLSTGVVSIGGEAHGGAIAGFTGDGDLNVTPARGVLEHIALTNVASDGALLIDQAIDEMQFEAPEPDPVLPPTVVWPIIAGDTEVTVTDLQHGVDQVTLLLDHSPLLVEDVTTTEDVVFTLPAEAQTDETYTATQRVAGEVSEESVPVVVLAEPPAYTFALLLDEGGTGSCDYTTGGWEWVGVSAVEQAGLYWAPQGQPLFADDAVWQTVDIPLDDDDLVIACLGGDGALGPSPTGFYTIDSIWFTAAEPNAPGPWEVFVDGVQLIDSAGQVAETILGMEDGVNRLPFRRGQSQDAATASALSDTASLDGAWGHRLEWTYDGVDPESLGLLQRVGASCGTAELIDDTSTAIRFHLLCRGEPTNPAVPLPVVAGPIVVGDQDTVRVFHESEATAVGLYINGELAETQDNPGTAYTDFPELLLELGDSISARQTLPVGGESDFAYPRGVSDQPPPPRVGTPLLPGATSVALTNVSAAPFATASEVSVYVNGGFAGSAPGGSETVEVPTMELQPGDTVTGTQTVNGVTSAQSGEAIVADTTVLREYELTPTLAELSRTISAADLINGQIATLENGDVDPNNGVEAWNMDSGSACMEMMYTEPSPGFHGATPGGTEGGLIDLTDGLEGSTVEAVLADYFRAALVVRYDLDRPVNIREIVVFAANEDPGATNNGRLFQHYDLWVSTDNMQTFEPLALTVTTGGFGYLNVNDLRASFTRVYDGLSFFVVRDVTNLRLVFYDVSNTAGRFQDQWQGFLNEDPVYQELCPDAEPQDTDGYRKAFEAPIVKEIDVFGYYPGDLDGDGDVDLADLAQLLGNYGTTSGATYEDGDLDGDGDVDLSDLAELLGHYGEGP